MFKHDPLRYDFEGKLESYRIMQPNGCIEWQGSMSDKGYGVIKKDSVKLYVHRIIYEQTHGAIPGDKYVLHKCNNPKCSNIDHLYLGTQKDNMKDRSMSGRIRTDKYSNLTNEDFKVLASSRIPRKEKMKLFNIPEGSIDRIILRARTLLV